MQVYGVKAKVYIKYFGEMDSLSKIIAEGMILPNFYFETNDEPPHELSGHCETLGFSLWLIKSTEFMDFNYVFELETNESLQESFHDHMHDISPWLSRYLSKICKIESSIGNVGSVT